MTTLDQFLEQEQQIMRRHRHPSGADAILLELRRAGGAWVYLDSLTARTGQRNVRSRMYELRKRGHVIEHNGRAGGRSAYRLVMNHVG